VYAAGEYGKSARPMRFLKRSRASGRCGDRTLVEINAVRHALEDVVQRRHYRRIIVFVAVAFIVVAQVLGVRLVLQELLVLPPWRHQLAGLYVVDEAGVGVDPLHLPLVVTNVLKRLDALHRGAGRPLLAKGVLGVRLDVRLQHYSSFSKVPERAVSYPEVKICPTCSATYGNEVAFCAKDGAALRSQSGLEPGQVIRDKYQIVSELGRGGMAVVYRARHLLWNEDKALKVMLDAEQTGVQVKAFLSEAMVMRQLKHDNIVAVEDADYTEDRRPFVVMIRRGRLRSIHGPPIAPIPPHEGTCWQPCSIVLRQQNQGTQAPANGGRKRITPRTRSREPAGTAEVLGQRPKILDCGLAKTLAYRRSRSSHEPCDSLASLSAVAALRQHHRSGENIASER
jgi:hypothetical protein